MRRKYKLVEKIKVQKIIIPASRVIERSTPINSESACASIGVPNPNDVLTPPTITNINSISINFPIGPSVLSPRTPLQAVLNLREANLRTWTAYAKAIAGRQ